MTFVSYAQNFEDVMLWRALKHVENGFYIDVGAAWPAEHSVTKAFYERGWSGINIEPNPVFHAQLEQERPRDKNLRVAVGDHDGTLNMHFVGSDTGLSTLSDSIAADHRQHGWTIEHQQVAVTTLDAIWRQYVPEGRHVHFLKVDVEGLEEAVLRGVDWNVCQPWIVVVEATLPLTQLESHQAWEPILLWANYRFAYADGLNRFYVTCAHPELLEAFRYPPNYFDGFKLNAQVTAEARAGEAEARAGEAEARAGEAEARAGEAEARAGEAEARAGEAEARAGEAEARAGEAEARAGEAEARAGEAEARAGEAEARAGEAEARAGEAEARAGEAEARAGEAEARAGEAEARAGEAEARAGEADARARILDVERSNLRRSWSWRITGPLRFVAGLALHPGPTFRNMGNGILRGSINTLQRPLSRALAQVLQRPNISHRLNQWLLRYPALHQHLRAVAERHGVLLNSTFRQPAGSEFLSTQHMTDLAELSPRARRIYLSLKKAIAEKNKEGG